MNKILTLVVIGLLSACGSDAGKEVQTYQSLIDAAKSDPVKLSKQTENGVTIKFNVAEFSEMKFENQITYMKMEKPADPSGVVGIGINFPASEESKIGNQSELIAYCQNRKIETGVGVMVVLSSCVIK